MVADGVNNSAKHFLSVSVITGGTNENVSNNVIKFPFLKVSYHLKGVGTVPKFLFSPSPSEC